jgi:hypothetical protein
MVFNKIFHERLALFLVVNGRLIWLGRHGGDVWSQTPATFRKERKRADFGTQTVESVALSRNGRKSDEPRNEEEVKEFVL